MANRPTERERELLFNSTPEILATTFSTLTAPNYNPSILLKWLLGRGLPFRFESIDPCIVLYSSYKTSFENRADAQHAHRLVLAERLGQLLDTKLEDRDEGVEKDQVLYNSLRLASKLGYSNQLCSPLDRMFQRRSLNGSYDGVEHKDLLREAMAKNQVDARFHPDWLIMMRGETHPSLNSDPVIGFYGVTRMPESRATRGGPYLKAIGQGLSLMSDHLEGRPDRQECFRNLVALGVEAYPRSSWGQDLRTMSRKFGWPAWANEAVVFHTSAGG